jgi:hypothetical protein
MGTNRRVGMTAHWLEGDWEDPFITSVRKLLELAKKVGDPDLDDAIEDVEMHLDPDADDPRANGWVGDDGLP